MWSETKLKDETDPDRPIPKFVSDQVGKRSFGQTDGRGPAASVRAGLHDQNRLLAGIASGDSDCLAVFYDLHAPAAVGLAWKICGSRAIAEEVTQEAFLALWERPRGFDPDRGDARNFLMGIVHNKAIDAIRRESSIRRREVQFASALPEITEEDIIEAASISIRRQHLHAALDQLSPVRREAVGLAYLHGLSYREVAARLQIPLGTAKSRIRDGMIKLTALLAAHSSESHHHRTR